MKNKVIKETTTSSFEETTTLTENLNSKLTLTNSTNQSVLIGLNEFERVPRENSNETESDPEFQSKEKESQENESSEEDMNMVTGLISAFLGGLSKPDGGIDLEAIVGLLGSLSTQNDDGTYDFEGLTELLMGFFGGGGEEGGGSDIGAFAGGLLGAVIKGVAPGAKGAGVFTGKIVSGILPALSGPPPDAENGNGQKPQGLDSGGFLAGLLKTILSSSSGSGQGGGGFKFSIIKTIITSITSLFSSSSKKSGW